MVGKCTPDLPSLLRSPQPNVDTRGGSTDILIFLKNSHQNEWHLDALNGTWNIWKNMFWTSANYVGGFAWWSPYLSLLRTACLKPAPRVVFAFARWIGFEFVIRSSKEISLPADPLHVFGVCTYMWWFLKIGGPQYRWFIINHCQELIISGVLFWDTPMYVCILKQE